MDPATTTALTQLIVNQIVPLVIAVVSGLVAVLIHKINKWVKTKTDKEEILTTMDSVLHIVEIAVAGANETIVRGLKEAAADGKITKEEAEKIKSDVIAQIKGTIPQESMKVLSKVIADLDVYLGNLIEKMIVDARHAELNK